MSPCSSSSCSVFPLPMKKILLLSRSNWQINISMFEPWNQHHGFSVYVCVMEYYLSLYILPAPQMMYGANSTPLQMISTLFRACAFTASCFLLSLKSKRAYTANKSKSIICAVYGMLVLFHLSSGWISACFQTTVGQLQSQMWKPFILHQYIISRVKLTLCLYTV